MHAKVTCLVFLFLFSSVGIGSVLKAKNVKRETEYCQRCHGMETLAYRNHITGQTVDLYVDLQQYRQSNHRELECTTCHSTDFRHYPHPDAVKAEQLYCTDCHQDDHKFLSFRFPQIEQEVKRSVHISRFPQQFTCFSCHNPHLFKVSHVGESIAEVVRYANGICLSCHASLINPWIGNQRMPELAVSHGWLPYRILHWRSIRCVECHTTGETRFSHDILSVERSAKNCVDCHSKQATLLTSLYKYRSKENRSKKDWFNKVAFNQAYIIGMSRNETVDHWSLVILGLTVSGLAVHGLGRFVAARWILKKGNRDKGQPS